MAVAAGRAVKIKVAEEEAVPSIPSAKIVTISLQRARVETRHSRSRRSSQPYLEVLEARKKHPLPNLLAS